MKISVIISTYNGEKYVSEQINSIMNQTKQIDEVIIGDDASTDNTVEIITKFIYNNNLSNWKLYLNNNNIGWKKNFYKLVLKATGDIIFFGDQDDIWNNNKVKEMYETIIEQNNSNISSEKIGLLACDYNPLYEDNTKHITPIITRTMKNNGTIEQVKLKESFETILRPGCTYAVTRELLDSIKPFWNTALPHDAILWKSAQLKDQCYILHKNLMYWRRYNASTSTPHDSNGHRITSSKSIIQTYIKNYFDNIVYIQMIGYNIVDNEQYYNILRECEVCNSKIIDALQKCNIMNMIRISCKYRRHFVSLLTPIKYMLYIFKQKAYAYL